MAPKNFVEFGLYSERTVRQFSKSFCDHVQSEVASGLTKIACHIPLCYELDQYLATSDVVSSKLTHIELAFEKPITETKLTNLSRKFYNLTHITHEFRSDFTVDKLSKCLSVLENLSHITIDFLDPFDALNFAQETLEERRNSLPKWDKPNATRITPLVRIKSVHLNLYNVRDHQTLTEYLCLNVIVPNVQLLTIKNQFHNCIRCGGNDCAELRDTSKKSEWHSCIRAFLAPIVMCDQLKRIEYWDDVDLHRTQFSGSLDRFKDGLNSLDWTDFVDKLEFKPTNVYWG